MMHVKAVCYLRVQIMVVMLGNRCIALLFFLKFIVLMESISTYFNTPNFFYFEMAYNTLVKKVLPCFPWI